MRMSAHLHRLHNVIRDYAWGSTSLIPGALGTPETGEPQAEMWLGAHPSCPSRLDDGTGLDAYVAGHPEAVGDGGGFPFLMKLLAAGSPLSLQVHPDAEAARAGFAADEASGLPLDHPQRTYKDDRHKPEILVAMSDFAGLCGFREPAAAASDLRALLGPNPLSDVLDGADGAASLRGALSWILSGRPEVAELARAALNAARDVAGTDADTDAADTLRLVGRDYADDPSVLAVALLNRVNLEPGEALFLGAGVIHAYLAGLGIESMAPSDNVLRGGLTPKHIDIDGLLQIVRFEPTAPTLVSPTRREHRGVTLDVYAPDVEEFAVTRLQVSNGASVVVDELAGPSIVLVTQGALRVSVGVDQLDLDRGDSAFIAAGVPVRVEGTDAVAYATHLPR